MGIIGNIGLPGSYALLKEIVTDQDLPAMLRREVVHFIYEIDTWNKGQVDDPYITP